ncbi:hypothetical protein ACFV1W_23155 [Kitasatospora sp. NPDC059648]|uniref:hypothetical protein n=1 Tax=Kitasatospora sp. NPDC059648 TaxID=3346894 RepID=UPI003689DA68
MNDRSHFPAPAVAGWFARVAATARRRGPQGWRAERAVTVQPIAPGWTVVTPAVRTAVAAVPEAATAVQVPKVLPPVRVDREQLEQAVVAMVRSAWRRTPPGARVLVRAEVTAVRPGCPDVLVVQVADQGPNLAGEAKHWMFAGLGSPDVGPPAAAWQLKAPDGGRITLEDNPTGGLVRTLVLPVAATGDGSPKSDTTNEPQRRPRSPGRPFSRAHRI